MFRFNWPIACLLLIASLGLTGTALVHQHRELTQVRQERAEALQALKAVQATSVFREKLRGTTARKTASLGIRLDRVLVQTPGIQSWASEPVPTEVQDALRAALPAALPASGVQHSD